MSAQWTSQLVSAVLARQVFSSDLVCPNCTWTGYEADLLVVHKSLRLIDVEVKVSRSDLKADGAKRKWWCGWPIETGRGREKPRGWPPRVWKHYYAMPNSVWAESLLDAIPANSGVLTLAEPDQRFRGQVPFYVKTVRRAKPNRDAETISAVDAVNIARLASLRYWDTLAGKQTRWTEVA